VDLRLDLLIVSVDLFTVFAVLFEVSPVFQMDLRLLQVDAVILGVGVHNDGGARPEAGQ
jgi:hypothetical protein